jgi:hypothetical protein
MKDELFQELLESVRQGAAIMKGTMQPSRLFEFPETEVRALPAGEVRLFPKQVSAARGNQCRYIAELGAGAP